MMGLGVVLATMLGLVGGLGYAIYLALAAPEVTTASGHHNGYARGVKDPAAEQDQPAQGTAHRDAIAAAPMVTADPHEMRPGAPAATPAPTISVPAATRGGPAQVPTGFPHTPQGALGQLAEIETTILEAMSIAVANQVYDAWALPGGPGASTWELTRDVAAFLRAAEQGPEKEATTTGVAVPAAALVKGVDGPDWTVSCVLLKVRATIATDAQIGYGYCARLQWSHGRWMIAPGTPPAKAPSTWPGTHNSLDAGWRTWTPATGREPS